MESKNLKNRFWNQFSYKTSSRSLSQSLEVHHFLKKPSLNLPPLKNKTTLKCSSAEQLTHSIKINKQNRKLIIMHNAFWLCVSVCGLMTRTLGAVKGMNASHHIALHRKDERTKQCTCMLDIRVENVFINFHFNQNINSRSYRSPSGILKFLYMCIELHLCVCSLCI